MALIFIIIQIGLLLLYLYPATIAFMSFAFIGILVLGVIYTRSPSRCSFHRLIKTGITSAK